MGNEGQFPILMTGDASSLMAASQQTNQALEGNKLKLAELTAEEKKLTQGMEEAGQGAKKLQEHGEGLNVTHREMHRLLSMLGPEFSEMGNMGMMAMESSMLIPILAVVAALSALREHLQKVREETEKMAEEARKHAKILEEGYWTGRERLVELHEEHDAWIEALMKGTEDAVGAIDKQISKIKEVGAADHAVMEARKKDAEEDIKLRVASGEMTETEGKRRLGQIEDIATEADNRAKREARAKEIAATEAAKNEVAGKAQTAVAAEETASAAAEAGAGRGAELPGLITEAEGQQEEAEKKAREAKAYPSSAAGQVELAAASMIGPDMVAKRKKQWEDHAAAMEKAAQAARDHADQLHEDQLIAKEYADGQKKALEDARTEAKKLNDELETLAKRLAGLRESDKVQTAAENETEKANKAATAARVEREQMQSPEGKLVNAVAAGETAAASGQKMTLTQRAQEAALRQLLDSIHGDGQAHLDALRAAHGSIEALRREKEKILRELEEQKRRLTNTQNP
jgi:hypothetical protein